MNPRFLLFLFCLLILPSIGEAQSKKTPQKIASVEGLTEYQLDNGLKVLLFPDNSKQTITVNITYMVGSRHEGYGETGMAHLLEHLVFKGSPKHKDIPKELSDHGAEPNGTTWFDRTNYFESFAASEENLRWALDLEADRMVNSFIAKKDLDSEMTVVRNEYESGENFPTSVLYKRMLSTAYTWHNYGNTTIGARADIEQVPIDRLQAFYKKYYQPDNAILLVAGKIDEVKTLELVNEYFGKIPRPTRKLIPTYTEEPTQDGERFVNLKRAGDVKAMAVLYHICSGIHPDYAAIEVLLRALSNRPSGRLYKNLVDSKKASQQYAYSQALKEPGFAYFGATTLKENSIDAMQATMLATIDSLSTHPLTEEEVNRAKKEIQKQNELAMANTERIGLYLSEYIAMGDWRLLYISRDRIEKVTTEDVTRVAKFYFKPSNRTVGQFIPTEEIARVEIPKAPSISTLVTDYKGRAVVEQGEAFDPSCENIEQRTLKGELDNGTQFSLLPKETKGNVVIAHLGIRFGDENTLRGKRTAAALAATMIDKGGADMTRQEIKDFWDAHKAQVSFYGGSGRQFVRIETTNENLNPVMEKVLALLKAPAFPENEFDNLITQRIASIEQFKSEPFSQGNQTLSKHMNQYEEDHINYPESPEESIANLKATTLPAVKEFYKQFYGGGKSSTITVIGDFEAESVKKIIEEQLGTWKNGVPYNRPIARPYAGKSINTDVKTPDKANAVFMVRQEFKMNDSHPDYPALHVGNYLLGGGFLNSRLATRIRQKEGLSYGVGSFLGADGKDPIATFGAQAIYNPANKEKLEKAFFEEIQKVIKEGFTQEELDAAKKGLLQGNILDRADDSRLLTVLNNNMFYQRDMGYYAKFDEQINNLTLNQINTVFKKYIKPDQFNVVKAGDFKEVVIKP